jgi:hypothetical protein
LGIFTRVFIELRQQQDLQAISINRQFPIFSQTKKKEKIKHSQGFRI